jgi:ubiquinone/menaquinone biosynthesis C-methylase UbiE
VGSRAVDLFASAAPRYARHRSGYPSEEVDLLAAQVGLDAGRQAIDIVCGTGQLTVPLARHAGSVVAIDPVVGMLAHGRDAAQVAGLTNITWVQGDSTRLPELVEAGFQVATFAASFHWTDRAEAVEALDALLAPGASIVVIDDDLDDAEQPDWVHAIADILTRYPALDPAPGALTRLPDSHRDILERSTFAHVQASTWSWTRQLDIDQVIGPHLTYSFSTPARLGDRVNEFCDEIRDAVLTLHPGGLVTEPFRVEVLVASRP